MKTITFVVPVAIVAAVAVVVIVVVDVAIMKISLNIMKMWHVHAFTGWHTSITILVVDVVVVAVVENMAHSRFSFTGW